MVKVAKDSSQHRMSSFCSYLRTFTATELVAICGLRGDYWDIKDFQARFLSSVKIHIICIWLACIMQCIYVKWEACGISRTMGCTMTVRSTNLTVRDKRVYRADGVQIYGGTLEGRQELRDIM